MRTLTCSPEVEVLGQNMLSLIDNLSMEVIQPILKKHGFENVEPDEWYPAQEWLNVINDLMADRPWTSEMVVTGMSIAENGAIPPELENAPLEQILGLWDDIYQLPHRGGDIGEVIIEKLSDTHIKTVHRHLYPDALTYGIAYGWARRFLPEGARFSVYYDQEVPHLDQGGTETIIHVRWEQ
jgi:hypothetical protein